MKKKHSYFLWPSNIQAVRCKDILYRKLECDIEKEITDLYGQGHAVLTSSGRAALVLSMYGCGLTRSSTIGVFPFASHCVLEAIAKITNPTCGESWIKQEAKVFFHQWGYIQDNLPAGVIVDDAADSLCLPGASLFPANSNFEVWSLPKSLGVSMGGILWCRNEEDAIKLRKIRDEGGYPFFLWLSKQVSSHSTLFTQIVYSYLSACLSLHPLATYQIHERLKKIEEYASDRKEKHEILKEFCPAWLPSINGERYPCVVPVEAEKDKILQLEEIGITSGMRNYALIKSNGECENKPVFPIPIHQEVPLTAILQAYKILRG